MTRQHINDILALGPVIRCKFCNWMPIQGDEPCIEDRCFTCCTLNCKKWKLVKWWPMRKVILWYRIRRYWWKKIREIEDE